MRSVATSPGLATLLQSDGFFSGAVCFVWRTLARSAFHGFSIGFPRCKQMCEPCRSRQELSNVYLVFACKNRLRHSRERASQSLLKISQQFEKKVRINIGSGPGPRSGSAERARGGRGAHPARAGEGRAPRARARSARGAERPVSERRIAELRALKKGGIWAHAASDGTSTDPICCVKSA